MYNQKLGNRLLYLAAAIATFTAFAHLSCIPLGETCYRAQLAPEIIIQSAIQDTWLAPLGTLFVSSLFLLCALYALSAAKTLRKMPLLKLAVYTIALLCIVRGVATIPFSYFYPDSVSNFSLIAGFIWFITGVFFWVGYRLSK